MKLHSLKPAEGSTRVKKRVGRGQGSGKGGTSTRGSKGAGSRAGNKYRAWFEGGQMPLYRRVPKFGFKNPFRVDYQVINLDTLQLIIDRNPTIAQIDHAILLESGIISSPAKRVKLLGRGEVLSGVTVKVNKFSASAKAALEAAGGTAIEV